ncbi:MAG: hypothetical protein ACKV2O_16715 [Acidimicrobiales bacterium]
MSTFGALCRTILPLVASRARLVALSLFGVGVMLVGLAIGLADTLRPERAAAMFVNGVGLSVLVPVVALVFASACFGDLVDDATLVYLWLRPVPRWQLAAAAYVSALSVVLPLTVVPLCVGAALAGGGTDVLIGTAAAVTVGVVTYCALFLALGLRVQRALAWGLAYILIWEGFVAQAGRGASRLAIRAYTSSVLSETAGVTLRLANATTVTAVVVPLLVAAVAIGYTTFRLGRHDVP